jgi:probable F420-dependent oxidoreductase
MESDPGTARTIARSFLDYYLKLPNYAVNLKRLGFTDGDLAEAGSDRLVDALVAWGGEDAIRGRLQQFFAAGADHLALQAITADGRSNAPLSHWRRLADLTR